MHLLYFCILVNRNPIEPEPHIYDYDVFFHPNGSHIAPDFFVAANCVNFYLHDTTPLPEALLAQLAGAVISLIAQIIRCSIFLFVVIFSTDMVAPTSWRDATNLVTLPSRVTLNISY